MKLFKKIYRFLINNYFLTIFFASIAFVGFVSVYKLFFVKPTYVYAKVKMGQGLWWASTQKPSIWFIKSLKKQIEEKDLTGKPIAKILSFRYYRWYPTTSQYDVYLTMRLKVSKMGSGKYNFKRSAIGVGAPVDFEFPQAQFSGTIIELSEKPIKDQLIEKVIYLQKSYAYPWEFENIKIGDSYFDGEEKVFEILNKNSGQNINIFELEKSLINPTTPTTRIDIIIKAKIKVKSFDGKLFYGEEQLIAPGKIIDIATDNFQFQNYLVAKVE